MQKKLTRLERFGTHDVFYVPIATKFYITSGLRIGTAIPFCEQCYAKLFESKGYRQDIMTAGSVDQSGLVIESSDIISSSDVECGINDSDNHRKSSELRISNNSDKNRPYLTRSRYSSPTKFRSNSSCRPYKTSYHSERSRYLFLAMPIFRFIIVSF